MTEMVIVRVNEWASAVGKFQPTDWPTESFELRHFFPMQLYSELFIFNQSGGVSGTESAPFAIGIMIKDIIHEMGRTKEQ